MVSSGPSNTVSRAPNKRSYKSAKRSPSIYRGYQSKKITRRGSQIKKGAKNKRQKRARLTKKRIIMRRL
jgi:hypothetical protein